MINRSKQRYIAYAFFTIAFILLTFAFFRKQEIHIENNWYVTVREGDVPQVFTLAPNIPYLVDSENYITHYQLMRKSKAGFMDVICSEDFGAPEGLERILGTNKRTCLRVFNITCSDTTYLSMQFYLTGFVSESATYEVHKNRGGGTPVYFNHKNKKILLYKDF